MMQTIKFGTDGWRAIMKTEFTDQNLQRVAQAFAIFVMTEAKNEGRSAKVVIGYDYRDRSDEFAKMFTRILLANGIQVTLSDRAMPTQTVSRAVINHGYNYGIAITASHNPGAYNGVKIKDAGGSSAELKVTNAVEALIDTQPVQMAAEDTVAACIQDIFSDYIKCLKEYLKLEWFNKRPLNIVMDSMHGVGAKHIEELLKDTAVKVTTLRSERDINFGGVAPEPILKNFGQIVEWMKAKKFDAAFATDGDADRIGAVRQGGTFVSPGTLLTLIMIHLVEDMGFSGDVVTTVSNTALIYKVAKALGLKVHETPVGFKYLVDIMRHENVLIAGEESGGLAFQGYMFERDGLISALLLIQMMEYRNQTFDEILNDVEAKYGKFIYSRFDTHYPEEAKPKLLAHLQKLEPTEIAGIKVLNKNQSDGIKFELEDNAWLLFRMSGTEPLLRIYGEASIPGKSDAFVQWGRNLADSFI